MNNKDETRITVRATVDVVSGPILQFSSGLTFIVKRDVVESVSPMIFAGGFL